jgi:FKBP-type peptidyl-prolyl cis-trans isomerase
MVLSLRPALAYRALMFAFACVFAGAVLPAPLGAAPRGEFSAEDRDIIEKRWPDAGQTASGMRYVILQDGTGPKARNRQRLSVLYKGSLLDGTVFSEKTDAKDPFKFTVGNGEVILGWEEAFLDMRAGEKRLLIIPFALGYGLRGREPDIPNRATLVFEVELLKIE